MIHSTWQHNTFCVRFGTPVAYVRVHRFGGFHCSACIHFVYRSPVFLIQVCCHHANRCRGFDCVYMECMTGIDGSADVYFYLKFWFGFFFFLY